MPLKKRNKPRILLALYARPKHPEVPHYALLVIPKITPHSSQNPIKSPESIPATKYHIKNTLQRINGKLCQPWRFDRDIVTDLDRDLGLLVCTVIGKVLSMKKLERALHKIPIYQVDDCMQFKARDFDYRMWVKDAVEELQKLDIIAGVNWRIADGATKAFLTQKHDQGRWTITSEGRNVPFVPILDLLTGVLVR